MPYAWAFLKRHWLLFLIGFLMMSLLFNRSFRTTLSRRKAIRQSGKEVQALGYEVHALREKIDHLQTDPSAYEEEVRKDLGYVRPGEKEVRFLKTKHP